MYLCIELFANNFEYNFKNNKKYFRKKNARGIYTFTNRGLQTDMTFSKKTKIPFPSPVQKSLWHSPL
jgi:hypothetical protein